MYMQEVNSGCTDLNVIVCSQRAMEVKKQWISIPCDEVYFANLVSSSPDFELLRWRLLIISKQWAFVFEQHVGHVLTREPGFQVIRSDLSNRLKLWSWYVFHES